MVWTRWGVSQSKGQVEVSSREEAVLIKFSWETKSVSVAKSLWLVAKVKNVKGTKGESVKSKGMGGSRHTPAPCTEPLFFSYTFHLPPHPSFQGKPIKTWKILKFRRTNIREENRSKLPFYDGIAKEKPWRTEISIRVLSYLLWSIQQNTHPTSPQPQPTPTTFWYKLFNKIY